MLDTFKKVIGSLDLPAGSTVIVGVSGGPDSLALLHLFVQARAALDLTPIAVTVDHGIRAEAVEDAHFVEQMAAEWGVKCRIDRVNAPGWAAEEHLSLEEAARLARYRALAQAAEAVGATVIAVGHHADDQTETVLLNLIRGAGLAGLSGMQQVSPLSAAHVGRDLPDGLTLVRPLLEVSRAEIEAYCAEHGLTPRIDETNTDITFSRNLIRHDLLPRLAALNPNIRGTLTRTAAVLSGEYQIVQGAVVATWQKVLLTADDQRVSFDRTRWRHQTNPIQRALIRQAVTHLTGGVDNLGFETVEAAVETSRSGNTGARADLPGGITLGVDYDSIWLAVDDSHPVQPDWPLLPAAMVMTLDAPGVISLPGGWQFGLMHYEGPREGDDWRALLADPWQAVIGVEGRGFPMVLRTRRPGDRFYPMGAGGSQSLSDFYIDHRVPAIWRDRLPLLVVGGDIAWVTGWRVDTRFAVHPDSGKVWHAYFRRSEAD